MFSLPLVARWGNAAAAQLVSRPMVYPQDYGTRLVALRDLDTVFPLSGVDQAVTSVADARYVGAGPATCPPGNAPMVRVRTGGHPQVLDFAAATPTYLIEALGAFLDANPGGASFTFFLTYLPRSQVDGRLLGLYEAAIYDGNGCGLTLRNTPDIAFTQYSGVTTATAFGDRAAAWRTVALVYDKATVPNPTITIVDRGVATTVDFVVPPFNLHTITAIVGSAAVGGAGGALPFDGWFKNWGVVAGGLTAAECRLLRPWMYRGFRRLVHCVGNSIVQGTVGPSVVTHCQQQTEATIALEVSRGQGGATDAMLLVQLDACVAPALVPQSDMLFWLEGGNSIAAGATAAQVIGAMRAVKAFATQHGMRLVSPTILPRTTFTPQQNAVLATVNAYFLTHPTEIAYGAGYVPDVATVPVLANPAGPGYVDGVHPSALGAAAYASYMRPFWSLGL